MQAITDLADQAVMLPLGIAVLAVLLAIGWRRAALAWAGVMGGLLGGMLLAKLSFAACGPIPAPGDPWGPLANPSGHTAAAAALAGGAFGLLATAGRNRAWMAGGAAVVTAAVIGTTRVVLHHHSIADVTAGAAAGLCAAMLLAALAGSAPPAARRRWLLLPLVAAPLLLHGLHLNAEPRIHEAAHAWLRGLCP